MTICRFVIEEHKDEVENSLALPPPLRLLVVDGNNVRGIGKFELNPLELQHQVVRFCYKYRIPNVMIVWDHGSEKFALSNNNEPSTIRFSRRKRAKGFAVTTDTKRLLLDSDNDNGGDDNNSNNSNNDNGIYHNRNITSDTIETNKYSDSSKSFNKKECPMFCDSTGFVKLLEELPKYNNSDDDNIGISIVTDNYYDQRTLTSLKETKESIVRFIKLSNQQQSRGGGGGYKLNPRREKTWERCIQAEIFRRSLLLQQQQQQQQQQSSLSTPSSQDDNVLFFTKYLEELQVERGYHNHRHSNLSPVNSIDNNDGDGIENDNDNDSNTFQPFQGPSRLDKRERRLLDRYNSLLKKGEIP
ncbi:hypothetical protein FRACYDRAFT_238711 [Fragilariopsis cylindrus CCMP1102]|uniref:Uncharacterized protein n=1 Tax=Fragilariopsis cylindrus CCMP1102 TaxID=635003 RepID=A0A1E7FDJ8_9STRA|nr:hypothetical protein FRACYDRAFT_238711 [Fragilariopsis cylindrus CCMP1102]|eukprot:OEU16125.1 hypothetical protein FRACYDRAFT_238711 [Fragilariopsis cylindrus CCMP1102]